MSECSFVAGVGGKVIQQIQARQRKFGKSPKTDEELSVIHGNCPWVVLRSGVDAPKTNTQRFEVIPRTEPQPLVTNDWAKKAVLGGELQDRSQGAVNVRPSGIQTVSSADNQAKSAYRLTTYQGHRPVPGITEVTVRSKDTWGMIMEADIKIKCWSRDDLDLLDMVYFKPGYTALLEWGHTAYFDENENKCITPHLMISDEEFFDAIDGNYLYLDQKILDKRKENCNQDAVFGYITNFSFSLNKDGSYDCSVKLLSKGSVIGGLKIKNASQFSEDGESEDQDELLFEDRSVWHRLYKAFEYFDKSEPIIPEDTEGIGNIDNPGLEDYKYFPPRDLVKSKKNRVFNGKQAILEANAKKNGKDRSGTKKKLFDPEECKKLTQGFPVVTVPVKVSGKADWLNLFAKNSNEYYITLRSLLYLVNVFNSEGRFQFNLWDEALYVDPPSEAELPTVSLNPYVAVKPKQGGTVYDILSGEIKYIPEKNHTNNGSESAKPRILNIWIDFGQFVTEIDHQISDKVEDYSIFEALEALLGRIQKAFGNINEFKIVADHKLGDSFYTIIDAKCIDTADGAGRDVPEIQVTGLENTVSNLTITSEISSDIANSMCIAAQAPRTYEDSSESSDEAMIHWGENCQQRWRVPDATKKLANETTDEKKKSKYENKQKKWQKKLEKQYKSVTDPVKVQSGSDKGNKTGDAVLAAGEQRFLELQLDGERFIHGKLGKDANQVGRPNFQMGIIPIRAGLTMMGIGNLTIGNVFKMKSGVLLPKYENWGHIITGIEHRITKGRWETTLKTQYYPIYTDKQDGRVSQTTETAQESVNRNTGAGISTQYRVRKDMEALDETCNYYDAMTKHAGYTWGQKHWCARYTAAWARAYAMGKTPLYTEPQYKEGRYMPPQGAGGSAKEEGHVSELKSYGYTEVSRQTGATLQDIRNEAAKCSEGDVLIYYNTNTGGSNMHSQFKSNRGWVSDFDQNSGCVYQSGTNYTIIHLKAPARNSDWDCSI